MAASYLSSKPVCSSSLSLQPRRRPSLVDHGGPVLLPPRSSPCRSQSQTRLSSKLSLHRPVTLASSYRRSRAASSSAVSGSTETPTISEEDTDIGGDLSDKVQVLDLNGNAVPISDLWKDRKAVVAFARHFGCVLCRKRADYLASKKDRMDSAGVALVLIGPGNVEQAKAFVQQTKFEGEVYADPDHSSYEALRFVSGVSTTFTPGAGLKIVQAYMEGYRQDWKLSSEKDTVFRGGWQQGGIIVAGPGKRNISYIHRDKEAGDDPDIEKVLAACCS